MAERRVLIPTPVGGQGTRSGPSVYTGLPCLQLELEVDEVFEVDFEAVGAAAFVAEVDLAEGFGGDLAEVVLVGAVLLGLEEAGGVVGRRGG